MMIEARTHTLTSVQSGIIKTVLYFDVFNYPLTENELFQNSNLTISKSEFTSELELLIDNKFVLRIEGFILNLGRSKIDIVNRLKGNAGAKEVMPIAYKYSKKIASFPFVEGVCLSGALSKQYYDEKGDIDFFIITSPGRLWLCRTLLILNYKLLPKSKKRYWCTNYFISADDLTLPDINAFTATELAFLIPTVNYSLYRELLDTNSWYKKYYPNKSLQPNEDCSPIKVNKVRALVEALLFGRLGKFIDGMLLRFTLKHWKKKYPDLSEEDFELQFRSQKNVCKRHTKGFQNKVLKSWHEKQVFFKGSFKVGFE